MPVVTRLQAKKQQEKRDREQFYKLGQEIIQRGGGNYLGKGAIIKDDLSWRQWVIFHINRNKCPYS